MELPALLSQPNSGVDAVGLFVVASAITVAEVGSSALEHAFRHRLHAVEGMRGFCGLQLWREPRKPGEYLMVSWWTTRADWVAYMKSAEHDVSHARIPAGPVQPRPAGLRTFEVAAT